MEKFQLITKINEKSMHFTYRVNSVFKNQVTFRHCTESQVTYNHKHCALPVLHCGLRVRVNFNTMFHVSIFRSFMGKDLVKTYLFYID